MQSILKCSPLLLLGLLMSFMAAAGVKVDDEVNYRQLDLWLEREVMPVVVEQFNSNPYLKNKKVLIVGFDGQQIQTRLDGFSVHLHERLSERLLTQPQITLINRVNRDSQFHPNQKQALNCGDMYRIDVFLGTEVRFDEASNSVRVVIKALTNKYQGEWVPGISIGGQWRFNPARFKQFKQPQSVDYLRGMKFYPYQPNEKERLVKQVADNINCILKYDLTTDFTLYVEAQQQSKLQQTMVGLFTQMLNQGGEVTVTANREKASHIVQLHEFLANESQNLYMISAQVQDKKTGHYVKGAATHAYIALEPAQQPLFISLRAETPKYMSLCDEPNPMASGIRRLGNNGDLYGSDCLRLSYQLRQAADVYIVHRERNGNTVLLLPNNCAELQGRPLAVEAFEVNHFPGDNAMHKVLRFDEHVGLEDFYFIAATDSHARQQSKAFLSGLKMICENSSLAKAGKTKGFEQQLDKIKQQMNGQMSWDKITINHRR